jgi:hypothetical protein
LERRAEGGRVIEPVVIRLIDRVTLYADAVAAMRHGSAYIKNRKNKNNLVGDFDDLLWLNRVGTRCEAAAKIYLNPIRWHAFEERITGLPDLGDFIDVKGRSRERYDLPVQKDDEDHFAYLLVTAERHPDYLIWGWCYGYEAKQDHFWDDPKGNRPAYFVPKTDPVLRSPEELRDEVRARELVAS